MRQSLAFFLCLAFSVVGRAQTVTLDVVEDSWIHGLSNSTNHGESQTEKEGERLPPFLAPLLRGRR